MLAHRLELTGGSHDVFGLVDPHVTRLVASLVDGSTTEARLSSGTFTLTWNGANVFDKLTAYAADQRLTECRPPGRDDFLKIELQDKTLLSYGCGP